MSVDLRFDHPEPTGLETAVLANDVAELTTLLQNGQDVNTRGTDGNTPLHTAVLNNKLQAFDHLLTVEGLAIDPMNDSGRTPLHLACKSTTPHFIRQLLDKGADITAEDHFENTPLLIGHKDPQIISLLVKHGSWIDHQNWEGHTALHLACLEPSIECVSALLYWGADPWICNREEQLPVEVAIQENARDIVDLLFLYCYDGRGSVEVKLKTITLVIWYKCDIFQDLVDRGELTITFDEDDLSKFERNLWNLDPDWLGRFAQPLQEAWTILFQPDVTRLPGKFWYYCEHTKVTANLLRLFADRTVGPMLVEHANTVSALCNTGVIGAFTEATDVAIKGRYSEDRIVERIFYILSYGVDLTAMDLVSIHQQFGYCPLFRDLLFMDVVNVEESEVYERYEALIPSIYFDVRHGVEYYMAGGKFFSSYCYNKGRRREVEVRLGKELLGLFADSRLYDYLSRRVDNEVLVAVARGRRRFPTLLELSRNAAREHVLQVFDVRNARQYYGIVDNLPLARFQKDVLLFKQPLYFV